jgi:hypothetical protein
MTSLAVKSISIPSSPIGENPFPFFHDQQVVRSVNLDSSIPLELRDLIGWQTNDRVLPYRLQDRYSRQLTSTSFKSWVLENEWLTATFLPQMGGRLISLFDKQKGRELLSQNPEFQPANLAIRNAWISGGIEWNVGRFGHSVFTCSPVFAAEIVDWNGDPGLRIYEFERTQCLFWQIDFFLPTNSKFLIAHARILNPRTEPTSAYWWTNMAVPQQKMLRVLAPAQNSIIIDPLSYAMSSRAMPHSLDDQDISYPAEAANGNELFMLTQSAGLPWITALDEEGYGLVEASTHKLGARKLFFWGTGISGRRWQEHLSPSGKPYVELQAGLAPTQLHGLVLPARTSWQWTEVFGALETDPTSVHHENWNTALHEVEQALKQKLSNEQLAHIDHLCQNQMDKPANCLLYEGSGWGALEIERLAIAQESTLPPAFAFPGSCMNGEQKRWLELLHSGVFPPQPAQTFPGEWVTQKEWRGILGNSMNRGNESNWLAWLHLGVMLYESSDEFGAEQAWLASANLQRSAWAYRNLGVLYRGRNQLSAALLNYRSAWECATDLGIEDQTSLAQEYLHFLYEIPLYDTAFDLYQSLQPQIQMDDRIQITRGQIALARNDLDTVDTVLQKEYAVIRENETTLSDMWYEVTARRIAESTGQALDDALRAEVKRSQNPPYSIRF